MDRQQTLAKAVEYHQAGDVESAKSMYKALLNASLDHNNLCYMLGLAECQTGQVKSGLVRLADTMRLYPDAVPVREQFRNFLRAALGEAPAPSHFGSLSSVVEDLWPVVASPDGQGGAVALEIGGVLADMGRWEEAATLYARALQLHPLMTGLLDGWEKARRWVGMAFLYKAIVTHLNTGAVAEAVAVLSRAETRELGDGPRLIQMALKTLIAQIDGGIGTLQTLHWHWKRLNFLRPDRRDNFFTVYNVGPVAVVAAIPELVRRIVLLSPNDLEILQAASMLLTVCGRPEDAYDLCRLASAAPTPARERISAEIAYLLRDHAAASGHYESFLRLINATPAVEQPLPEDAGSLLPSKREGQGEPVILTSHWGNPEFLPYVLVQNALSNPGSRVILLGDSTNRYQGIEHYPLSDFLDMGQEFRDVYRNKSYNGYCYELFCFDRWFSYLQWMEENNINEAYIVDSDLMIFENLANVREVFAENQAFFCNSSGHFSFFTKNSLRNFCDYMIDIYRSSSHPLHNAEMIVDMSVIKFYQMTVPHTDLCQVWNGRFFDGNIQAPQDFAFHAGLKWINFRPDPDGRLIPYGYHEPTGTDVRFCTLHFQGGSKRWIQDAFGGRAVGSRPPPLKEGAPPAAKSIGDVFQQEEAYFRSLAERLEAQAAG